MADHKARPRRQVHTRWVPVLRLLGWRYSHGRRAWVHRLGGGRLGPVFGVGATSTPRPEAPTSDEARIAELLHADRLPTAATAPQQPPLPRRPLPTPHGGPEPIIDLTDGAASSTLRVDGRPPRRDHWSDLRALSVPATA